jgi:putative glutamine amidotransferase
MGTKAVIGITGAYVQHNPFMEGLYVHHDYHKSVALTGGLPIVLPYINPEFSQEMLQLCDGLILSGGEDVDPKFYGQDSYLDVGATIAERDEVEIALARQALQCKIPLLAICRGLQILNVALGGTLIQDISRQVCKPLQHVQISDRSRDTHWVMIETDSRLYKIFGQARVRVNSLHHQALDGVATGLKVAATASDGIVEAVEYTGNSFAIGVQWHPESLASSNLLMKKLFVEFINSAKNS